MSDHLYDEHCLCDACTAERWRRRCLAGRKDPPDVNLTDRIRLLDLPPELHDRDRVIAFQRQEGLTADGDPGPITYGRWLDRQFAAVSPAERLRDPGTWEVNRQLRLWCEDLVDPPRHTDSDPRYKRHREAINAMVKVGLGWTWKGVFRNGTRDDYACDGDYAWCGAARAHGSRQVGLRADLLLHWLSSTDRLDALARGVRFAKNQPPPYRAVERYERLDEDSTYVTDVRPGDVLLVGGCEDGDDDWGTHITTVVRYDEKAGLFFTVEGNARGKGPDGKVRQGVIRTTRPLGLRSTDKRITYHARRLIRFAREAYAIPG